MTEIEENTHWISIWITNDYEYYHGGRAVGDDPDALREYVEQALQDAPDGSAAWHTAREMSTADYDLVDWVEILHDLSDDE